MNTAWLVMHSPYLRHLREETVDGCCHASAMEQDPLLPSVFSQSIYTTGSPLYTYGRYSCSSYLFQCPTAIPCVHATVTADLSCTGTFTLWRPQKHPRYSIGASILPVWSTLRGQRSWRIFFFFFFGRGTLCTRWEHLCALWPRT